MTKTQIKKWWRHINTTKKVIAESEENLVDFKKKSPKTRNMFLEGLIEDKKKLLNSLYQLSLDGEIPFEVKKSYKILVLRK